MRLGQVMEDQEYWIHRPKTKEMVTVSARAEKKRESGVIDSLFTQGSED